MTQHQRFRQLSRAEKAERQKSRGNDCDARRQAVHVVEQVYGIGDSDQPEDRQRHVQCRVAGPWQTQAVIDHEGRTHHLPDQFLIRLGVQKIVRQADQEQESAGAHHHVQKRSGKVSPNPDGVVGLNEHKVTDDD